MPFAAQSKVINSSCFILSTEQQENDDIQFGGYAPSLGGGSGRPTTAPNKRSVSFADDLGFDEGDDDGIMSQRPKTAPPAKNNRPKNLSSSVNNSSDFLDSSLEESMSRELFKNSSTSKSGGLGERNRKTSKKKNFVEEKDENDSPKENETASKTKIDVDNKNKGDSSTSKNKKGIPYVRA